MFLTSSPQLTGAPTLPGATAREAVLPKEPGVHTERCLSPCLPSRNPAMGSLEALPFAPRVFADAKTTCSIIIYRIICLFIVSFFFISRERMWTRVSSAQILRNLRFVLNIPLVRRSDIRPLQWKESLLKNGFCRVKLTLL